MKAGNDLRSKCCEGSELMLSVVGVLEAKTSIGVRLRRGERNLPSPHESHKELRTESRGRRASPTAFSASLDASATPSIGSLTII